MSELEATLRQQEVEKNTALVELENIKDLIQVANAASRHDPLVGADAHASLLAVSRGQMRPLTAIEQALKSKHGGSATGSVSSGIGAGAGAGAGAGTGADSVASSSGGLSKRGSLRRNSAHERSMRRLRRKLAAKGRARAASIQLSADDVTIVEVDESAFSDSSGGSHSSDNSSEYSTMSGAHRAGSHPWVFARHFTALQRRFMEAQSVARVRADQLGLMTVRSPRPDLPVAWCH